MDWQQTFELFLIVDYETEIRLHKNTPLYIDTILDSDYKEIVLDYKYINKKNHFMS